MRLLVITQDFSPAVGGIETYTTELVHRWARQAEHVEVVAPNLPEAGSVDAQLPFPVTRAATRPDLLPVLGLPTIVRRVRTLQPDVTFHAQWQTVGAAVLARRLTGAPQRIVCAAHGRELLFNPADGMPGLQSTYDALRRLLLRGPDRFTPVSRYTAGLLHECGVPPSRCHVVPNGTDPDHYRPFDASPLGKSLGLADGSVLLTVGRLVPRKGIDTTLHALPAVLDAVPDLTYLVVGTGPDRDRLERLATDLGIRSCVRFAGYVDADDLPTYYNLADAFVMPSREAPPDVEGFGIVFLEAGACGVPAIGARTGGIPDAIQEEETGLLVPPSSPHALADTLTHLLTSPALARRLGEQARRHAVQEANWDHVADQLWNVLASVQTTASPTAPL
ncbi:MAG: glycosyltransferase family 1 protein [Bacteroidetes bacterium SW_9_63_38]|nr:MAG: glycosyltransferase family 1 protein [Bacteroidetes bacterium SW_9_63_38]